MMRAGIEIEYLHQEQDGTAVGRDTSSSRERALNKGGGDWNSRRKCNRYVLRERHDRGRRESRDGGDGETGNRRLCSFGDVSGGLTF